MILNGSAYRIICARLTLLPIARCTGSVESAFVCIAMHFSFVRGRWPSSETDVEWYVLKDVDCSIVFIDQFGTVILLIFVNF